MTGLKGSLPFLNPREPQDDWIPFGLPDRSKWGPWKPKVGASNVQEPASVSVSWSSLSSPATTAHKWASY